MNEPHATLRERERDRALLYAKKFLSQLSYLLLQLEYFILCV